MSEFEKNPTLAKCPFCGFRAHQAAAGLRTVFYVTCSGKWYGDTRRGCGAEGPKRRTAKGAVKAWNRRCGG